MEQREIKFRGLDSTDIWIYGSPIYYADGGVCIYPHGMFEKYGIEATHLEGRSEIMPETVGQYTGIKDKNGIEIYEGDILNTVWEYPDSTAPEERMVLVEDIRKIPKFHGSSLVDIEVIGNIYENSEILLS